MITLKDFMECVGYRITDTSDFLWNCYGPNVRSMDYWNDKHSPDSRSVSVIFDTKNQVVYQMEAWDSSNNKCYRWIHPDYLDEVKAEYVDRNIDFKQSVDDNKFIDLDVEEDILKKATAIANEEEYDHRVMLHLDLSDEEVFTMMKIAHEKDMTFNKFIEYILQQEIDRLGVE